MIFNAIVSVFVTKRALEKKSDDSISRNKYISQKFHERSIVNRYFK